MAALYIRPCKVCGATFKIQSGILNCNSQKVVYLLKCRICGEAPYVVKTKKKFRARLIITKLHTGSINKNVVFMNIMGNTVIMGLTIGSSHLLNNVKHTNSWKGGKHFGNTGLKHFTLMSLMKRKNIYIITFPDITLIGHRIF